MKHLYLIFLFFVIKINSQNVVINELVARNVTTLNEHCDRSGCPDLIELLNLTNGDIDLSGYFLSDDPNNIKKWQFPSGITIEANSFLLMFSENASNSAPIRVNFNLSLEGETIILSDPSETEIQRVTYPTLSNDIAYGRLSNGTYSFMNTPSLGTSNIDSSQFEYLESNLTISLPSGLYTGNQSITLSHTGAGSIYYTLDGSTPTVSSILYTGPISINSNTILKAIVIDTPNSFSVIENRSFIINANHDLPVILLTSDNSINPQIRRNKQIIDGRTEFVFIETDGTTVINQYANFRESGNASRILIPQINGKIEANKAYGDGDFDYKMFPEKEIDEFDSFLFRNASQDWFHTRLRDAFISRLLGNDNLTNFPFEGYRPAVFYVNAVYHGIINIREDDDNDYVRHNFNLNTDEFRDGTGLFITPTDPLPTNRETLNSVINFNNYTNINVLRRYSALSEAGFGWWEDLSGKTGQRYHYFMHDYDQSFGIAPGTVLNLTDPMVVSELLDDEIDANPAYRNEALQFVAASLNHIYNIDRALSILDEITAEIENEIPRHGVLNERLNAERFPRPFNNPPFFNITEWQQNVDLLRNNIIGRIDTNIYNRIQTEYGLDTPIQVNYNSSNINQGFVRVHEIKVLEENASGTYFSNIPLKLSAEALPGFRFVRWEGDAVDTTTEIAPVFSTNASVTAVFEPTSFTPNNIVINEVQSRNDVTIADENGEFDDWIEVYNPDNVPVNLANFYFSDNPSEPLKWQIPDTDPTKTTVPANGYLLLWADNDLSQGENHLGFRLGRTDEVLITYPDATTLKQRIDFVDVPRDASFGAETDASSSYIVFNAPTPNASNNGTILSVNSLESKKENSFSLYPNPTNAVVTINAFKENFKTGLTWSVFSITGSAVITGKGDTVNMENLTNGLYFITINNSKTIKVVKE